MSFKTTIKLSISLILPVQHKDEAGDAVEHRHAHVRHGQVDQEVVGDAPHPPVSWTQNH